MPTTWQSVDGNSIDQAPHYRLPIGAGDCDILAVRKRAVQRRDEMLALQKVAAKERDFETARFFSDEAAHHLKHYKACLFVAPLLVSDLPGDCRNIRREEWPMELHQAMDNVLTGAYQ